MRTSFSATDFDVDDGEGGTSGDSVSDFALNSARLYISGKATDNIGFMFNTEYNSDDEEIRVIDAAAQFSFCGGKHNIWVGRFLPPSDRANLYGPYYASNWARVPGRRAGRLSVRDRRPRRRRHVLGPVRSGQVLDRRLRRAAG